MFREAQMWRPKLVATLTDVEPKLYAADIALSPALEVHDIWIAADAWNTSVATMSGRWTVNARLEFYYEANKVGELRVDRGNFAFSGADWNGEISAFVNQLPVKTPSNGFQADLEFDGGDQNLTIGSFRVSVEATSAKLFIENISNQTNGDVTFALGAKILSHTT